MTDHRLISHREDAATLLACEWRVGKSTGRALYVGTGDHMAVGWMDTPELAAGVVAAVNERTRLREFLSAVKVHGWDVAVEVLGEPFAKEEAQP